MKHTFENQFHIKEDFMKILILFLLCLPCLLKADVQLVKNGKAAASIVIPSNWKTVKYEKIHIYETEINSQAKRLVEYIKRSTGAELPICTKAEGAQIQFVQAAPGTMDIEGFSFTFPSKDKVVITVNGQRSLQYAVSEFLERYLGVRWIFPTALGTVIPKHSNVIIPAKEVKMQPSYLGRYLAGGNNKVPHVDAYYRWMLDNKGNFLERGGHPNHNLLNLLPVAKYGKSNPEFYPILNGKRHIPTQNIHWQPCFTEPSVIDAVVSNIPADAKRVSLGVNDGEGFCECSRCIAIDGKKINRVGQPDRTRSYLMFCNAVARKRPDVEFWINAYWCVLEYPEGIKLEPNLRYAIAYESTQFADPDRFNRIKILMDKWQKASGNPLSWYDYLYGGRYLFPRIFAKFLGNNLKWRYQNNVRFLTGEYYPDGKWTDSINIYVAMKVLWDINANIDTLIDDYCIAAVGAKAAPYLKKYFEYNEKIWTSPKMLKASDFAKETTYFSVGNGYLSRFPDDYVDRCEELLKKVLELSNSKERAKYFYDKFNEIKPHLL